MFFDNREVATRARNLITEQSEGSVDITLPRISAIIPTALESWSRLCFQNREKRELFKQRFIAEVSDGRLDLAPYLDGTLGRINLKELRETIIYDVAITAESEAESQSWQVQRVVDGSITAVEGQNVFIVTGAGFTAADIGRRLRIVLDTNVVVDSIITSVDGDECTTVANAATSILFGTATIFELVDSESESETTATEIAPYTWLGSHQQLTYHRPLGSDSAACFLEGSVLRTRTAKGHLNVDAAISFTVTNFPANVEAVPFTLRHDFIQFVAMMAMKEVANGNR
jgi:hypothetical protein